MLLPLKIEKRKGDIVVSNHPAIAGCKIDGIYHVAILFEDPRLKPPVFKKKPDTHRRKRIYLKLIFSSLMSE